MRLLLFTHASYRQAQLNKDRNKALIGCQFPSCHRKALNKILTMRKMFRYIVRILIATAIGQSAVAQASVGNTDTSPNAAFVTAEVVDFLNQQASNYPGSAHVTVDTSRLDRYAECHDLQVSLASGQRLRSRMSVSLRCLSPEPWTARVQATLAINGFFYVANRILEPGETVSLDDLIAREGDILSLARGVIIDPSQLIDHVVTQRIPAGTPLKANALRNPMSVERGQIVRTEARGPGFVVTGEAQTLQDGAPGERIRLRTSSGQIISATVMNAHTVQVMM